MKFMETIDQYIAEQPAAVQPILESIRTTIRAALPDAQERVSWGMPSFWDGRYLIHFGAFKTHIGVYPGNQALEVFADRLAGCKSSKGGFQLPLSKPVDYDLIADIARWLSAGGKD